MLGWFNKSLMHEKMRLFYLNKAAAILLKEDFENTGDMRASARMHELEVKNRTIAEKAEKGDKFTVSSEDAAILVEINRELRRFYGLSKLVEEFDDCFAPPCGWEHVYQSWEEYYF